DPLPRGALVRLGSTRLTHPGAHLEFSADSKLLISWGRDDVVRHWDLASGKLLRQELRPALDTGGSGWLPAGEYLVQVANGALQVRERRTRKELHRVPVGQPGSVARLLPSPDGKSLAVAFREDNDGSLSLWSLTTGKGTILDKQGPVITDLAFSAD